MKGKREHPYDGARNVRDEEHPGERKKLVRKAEAAV
jgi:hypothetical protein